MELSFQLFQRFPSRFGHPMPHKEDRAEANAGEHKESGRNANAANQDREEKTNQESDL